MSGQVPPVDDDPDAELRGNRTGVCEPTDMTLVTRWRGDKIVSQFIHRQRPPRPLRRPVPNVSRRNNGRTRRQPRRASSARRTSRSGARSSPSGSSDGSEPHPADGAGALTEYLASTACWLDAMGLGPWPGWDDLERESNARWTA